MWAVVAGVSTVRFLAAHEIRRRWRSAVALALLVGVVGAVVLATAAGARRSHSALPRFVAFSRAADVSFLPGPLGFTPTPSQLRAVRHVPGVTAVGEIRFFAVVARGLPQSASIGAPVGPVEGSRVERARVVAGRAANPSAPDELDVDEPLAAQYHLAVGGHIDLESYTPATFKAAIASGGQPPPDGPRVRLRIVGILRRPLDLGDDAVQGGHFLLTPGFNRLYRDRIGNFGVLLDVRTTHGASDVRSVSAAVQRIFAKDGGASPQGTSDATKGAGDAINVLTLALWILSGVAALAGIVTLGIVLSREISRVSVDQATLRSLGVTRSQRILTSAPRALLIAGGGGLLASLGAFAVSPLFPLGVARKADPNVGLHVDWVVMGPGFVALSAVVLAIALVAAYRSTRSAAFGEAGAPQRRASTIVQTATGLSAPPTVTNGLRMALEPGRGRTAVPVRSAYLGAVLGVLGVTGALVFAASLNLLVATPTRYGWTWDFKAAETNFNPTAPHACGSNDFGVSRVPGVGAVAIVCYDGVQVGGRPVIGWGYTRVRGNVLPGITAGRAPQSADEIALGALTLDALHKRVGDTVRGGPKENVEYRIVGRAVFPVLDNPQPLTDGAAFTGAGLARIYDSNAPANRFVLGRFAPGSDRAAVEHRVAALARLDAPSGATVPVEIARIHEINWLPTTIAALLGGLGLLAVGYALVTAVRRRGRELALLETLGFTRRQVHATVGWQATTLATVGLAVGIPAGLIVGRSLWSLVADGLGVTTGTAIPVLAVIIVVPCALALANLVAFLPARSAGRTPPGVALRSE
jgi:putative ABC transport system permease protein